MRDLILGLLILGGVLYGMRAPWVAIIGWTWISMMNPHGLSWRLNTAPVAQVFVISVVVGSVIGIPFFEYLASIGIGLPESIQSMGMMMGKRIFPLFSIQLIIGTVLLIVATATLVSYLPARKIARMNAVEALKGKLQ